MMLTARHGSCLEHEGLTSTGASNCRAKKTGPVIADQPRYQMSTSVRLGLWLLPEDEGPANDREQKRNQQQHRV
jgi:hypothetical protein